MNRGEKEKLGDVGTISLGGYYGIGLLATTIGYIVVILLNLFTPLEFFRTRIMYLTGSEILTTHLLLTKLAPKLLLVLFVAYFPVFFGMNRLLRPVAGCLAMIHKQDRPSSLVMDRARRRLLNLPFLFVLINVGMWILIPSILTFSAHLAGQLDHRTGIILVTRAAMVGLIASAIASHRIEAYSRQKLIPYFFPKGRLTEIKGAVRLSIIKRIKLVNRLGNVVPMIILLVTLLTLQWEVDPATVSADAYGRGIITFTVFLFFYSIIATGQLNRVVSRSITHPLNEMMNVLKNVRTGVFEKKVKVVSNDEIGHIGDVVNEMTEGLQERESMRQSLALAKEVQQSLLPKGTPRFNGLDVAGTSVYCDETGGDYYDFIETDPKNGGNVRIAIGDVSGHGISSALLMATARAFVRQRSGQPGTPGEIITDVNRHLTRDVVESGSFMTLLYLVMDVKAGNISWVRAGHDPALFYTPETDTFEELKGPGIALGLDDQWVYGDSNRSGLHAGQIMVLFTDGIWEAHNPAGERFGKEAVKRVIRENADQSAKQISRTLIGALSEFQEGSSPEDDVTLVVVKIIG